MVYTHRPCASLYMSMHAYTFPPPNLHPLHIHPIVVATLLYALNLKNIKIGIIELIRHFKDILIYFGLCNKLKCSGLALTMISKRYVVRFSCETNQTSMYRNTGMPSERKYSFNMLIIGRLGF